MDSHAAFAFKWLNNEQRPTQLSRNGVHLNDIVLVSISRWCAGSRLHWDLWASASLSFNLFSLPNQLDILDVSFQRILSTVISFLSQLVGLMVSYCDLIDKQILALTTWLSVRSAATHSTACVNQLADWTRTGWSLGTPSSSYRLAG